MHDVIKNLLGTRKYKSVLCLNSNVSSTLVLSLKLPIVATDGAANTLIENGITPDIVIGDMDSINPTAASVCNCVRVDDQDTTDFQKALSFIKQHELSPAIVTGLGGGFLDHSLMNFSIFSSEDLVYLSNEIAGINLPLGITTLSLPINTKLSIFGAPTAVVSSNGLKWELSNYELSFFEYNSTSNRTIAKEITLRVSSGRAVTFIYFSTTEP